MSRERELLQRVLDGDADRHWTISSRLYKKIEEVLAQPEQEPVAWGYKKRVTYKPEGSEEEEIIPLYTAPPKREPLTSKLISLGNNCHESFIKGIRFAEKMHGIGGGE